MFWLRRVTGGFYGCLPDMRSQRRWKMLAGVVMCGLMAAAILLPVGSASAQPIPVALVNLLDGLFPADPGQFREPILLAPDVVSEDEIASVEVFIDGAALPPQDGLYVIDPARLSRGGHQLRIRATDIEGDIIMLEETFSVPDAVGTDVATATIIPPTAPTDALPVTPSVSVALINLLSEVFPADANDFRDPIVILPHVVSDEEIVTIVVYIDDVLLPSQNGVYVIVPDRISPGEHQLRIRAVDIEGDNIVMEDTFTVPEPLSSDVAAAPTNATTPTAVPSTPTSNPATPTLLVTDAATLPPTPVGISITAVAPSQTPSLTPTRTATPTPIPPGTEVESASVGTPGADERDVQEALTSLQQIGASGNSNFGVEPTATLIPLELTRDAETAQAAADTADAVTPTPIATEIVLGSNSGIESRSTEDAGRDSLILLSITGVLMVGLVFSIAREMRIRNFSKFK